MRLLPTAVLLLVIGVPAAAEDALAVLRPDGDTPPARMLRAHLLADPQRAVDACRRAVAALKTPQAAADDAYRAVRAAYAQAGADKQLVVAARQ
jgi:hypothetical protein